MKLDYTGYFITPIFYQNINQWVKPLNKICDKHIKDAVKRDKHLLKKRNEQLKTDIKDLAFSFHSHTLVGQPGFEEFEKHILKASEKILDHIGYNTNGYEMFITELWVQEFAKSGAGHHESHIHYDNHISGFYFLKCSDRTSYPVFKDPRLAKVSCQLPEKNPLNTTFISNEIKFDPTPGTLILFPSFLDHYFPVDYGLDPFRFIHFNIQGVRKDIIGKIKNDKRK